MNRRTVMTAALVYAALISPAFAQAPKLKDVKIRGYVTEFFWSSHDNHATRRSYLMNELKNNYRDLDYAPLALKAGEYARIKAAVKDAKNPKRKLKISETGCRDPFAEETEETESQGGAEKRRWHLRCAVDQPTPVMPARSGPFGPAHG